MDMSILGDSILNLVLVVISIVISRYLVPWLKEKYTAEKLNNIYDKVSKAVQAAQKIYKESGQGILRKEYVIAYLKKMNINVTDAELDVLIESAVKMLDLLEAEIKKDDITKQ